MQFVGPMFSVCLCHYYNYQDSSPPCSESSEGRAGEEPRWGGFDTGFALDQVTSTLSIQTHALRAVLLVGKERLPQAIRMAWVVDPPREVPYAGRKDLPRHSPFLHQVACASTQPRRPLLGLGQSPSEEKLVLAPSLQRGILRWRPFSLQFTVAARGRRRGWLVNLPDWAHWAYLWIWRIGFWGNIGMGLDTRVCIVSGEITKYNEIYICVHSYFHVIRVRVW